jgi:acetyl-CoA C-acetyltransferase
MNVEERVFDDAEKQRAWLRAASEQADYLLRDQYQCSHVQEAVLERVMGQVGGVGNFRLLELYSCFPVVPKMARRTLALPANATVTSTGGLSFFGAPLNNYMTHACAALVRGLREQQDALALLYAQGGYLTSPRSSWHRVRRQCQC